MTMNKVLEQVVARLKVVDSLEIAGRDYQKEANAHLKSANKYRAAIEKHKKAGTTPHLGKNKEHMKRAVVNYHYHMAAHHNMMSVHHHVKGNKGLSQKHGAKRKEHDYHSTYYYDSPTLK